MRETLLNMLTYARPAGSRSEERFRNRWLLNLPGAVLDVYDNIHVEIGTGSRVIWSSHTDTVHREGGRQRIAVSPHNVVSLADGSRSNCLGADDTVGVYLMREMILANVPGYYVFHHGEECGGIGSSALAMNQPRWFARFDMAIALDRQGTGDIVTHQFGGRTASDRFAWSLAAAIERIDRLPFAPTQGVYTDTAEYADLIPECTNISVGYAGQHSREERVLLSFVDRMVGVLCQLDTADLVIERHPGDDDRGTARRSWDRDLPLDEDGPLSGCYEGIAAVSAGPRDAYSKLEWPDHEDIGDPADDDMRWAWDRSRFDFGGG
jgi:hypothetical protein